MFVGMDACIEKIKKGEVHLLILAEDASYGTKEKIEGIAKKYQIPCIDFGKSDSISQRIGESRKVVLGVTDSGLSYQMIHLISELKGDI